MSSTFPSVQAGCTEHLPAFTTLSGPASQSYSDHRRVHSKHSNATFTCLTRCCVILFAMLRNKACCRSPTPQPACPNPYGLP